MQIEQLINNGNVVEIQQTIRNGEIGVEDLIQAYLGRIEQFDDRINAVIAITPGVLDESRVKDAQIQSGEKLPFLFGLSVLVKDNIETKDLPTTAGSLALAQNYTYRDAPIIANLRAEGAIILGKTNLSEWANFRSKRSSSGWSAVGGQTRNPYDVNRSPCGSSSGSGASVAARFAPFSIGTETDGSVVCPANVNGLVGIKPTVGLLPQDHIIPISHSQDTAGPMAVNVESAAMLLSALAGNKNFHQDLAVSALAGKRLGVVSSATRYHEGVDEVFAEVLKKLEQVGAVLIEDLTLEPHYKEFSRDALDILLYEFKHNLNRYLAGLPNELASLTLDQLISFNSDQASAEMAFFPQDLFERSQDTGGLKTDRYKEAISRAQAETKQSIDALLIDHNLDALIAPSGGVAWSIDQINGDRSLGGFSTYPAVSGYPHLTLPIGTLHGLPVGMSLVAAKNQDAQIIAIAYQVENVLDLNLQPEGFDGPG